MRFFRRDPQRAAAVRTYKDALQALDEFGEQQLAIYGRGNCPESDEYHQLNEAVTNAERNVPWWRRR